MKSTKKRSINDELIFAIGNMYLVLNQQITNFLKPYGLTPAKLNILYLAREIGGKEGASQSQISSGLVVSAANITRLIDSLEKIGLLKRFASADDRRVNLIKITDKGRSLLDEVLPKYADFITNVFSSFSKKEKETFLFLIRKTVNVFVD